MLVSGCGVLGELIKAKKEVGLVAEINIELVSFVATIPLTPVMSSSLGILISVRADDVPGAMMPLNVIRLLMVFLCGAFISLEETFAFMPSLQFIAYLLPLTYSVEALRQATFGAVQYPVLLIDFVGLACFSMAFAAAAIKLLEKTLR